jgi:hypothetical protein
MPYLSVPYILLAIVMAWIGRRSRLGFTKMFLLSLFLTPAATFVYILLMPYERSNCRG